MHADLADPLVDAHGLDDLGPFLDLQGQRLLDVDVFAGVGRIDGDQRVPVIGRGDQHRVEVLLLEQLAVVAVGARARRLLLRFVDAGRRRCRTQPPTWTELFR